VIAPTPAQRWAAPPGARSVDTTGRSARTPALVSEPCIGEVEAVGLIGCRPAQALQSEPAFENPDTMPRCLTSALPRWSWWRSLTRQQSPFRFIFLGFFPVKRPPQVLILRTVGEAPKHQPCKPYHHHKEEQTLYHGLSP